MRVSVIRRSASVNRSESDVVDKQGVALAAVDRHSAMLRRLLRTCEPEPDSMTPANGLSGRATPPAATRHRAPRTFHAGYKLSDLRSDVLPSRASWPCRSMAWLSLPAFPAARAVHRDRRRALSPSWAARGSVSGPTAAFVNPRDLGRFIPGGLMVASMLAGVMLMLLGMARMGRLIEFIPYPVTTGFTAGIAVVIATLQIKDFLGLDIPSVPEHYWEKVSALGAAIWSLRSGWPAWPNFAVGAFTLVLLLILPRITKKIPAPIIALPLAAILPLVLAKAGVDFPVVTIHDRFPPAGIPQVPPQFGLAGSQPAPVARPSASLFDINAFRALLTSAFAIAMLGAIDRCFRRSWPTA